MNISQLAYYLIDNKIHSAKILSKMTVENHIGDDKVCTDEQRESFQSFGKECVKYATIHAILDESQLFATKEELLASL
jgi:copper oxidase (laccase) domain-containing protein